MEQDRYTLTYRAVEAQQVMRWIQAGQSGCLVGLRGAGKSNFLRFLLDKDVQQHYLGQDYDSSVFALIDLLALTERTEWAVYELILDRLVGRLRSSGIEQATVQEIASFHQKAIQSRDTLSARRAFEQCVNVLCQRPAQKIVLFLDEFDAVFWPLDPFVFRCLRAVRDEHKGQLSYIVVTDNPTRLQADLSHAEHFYRLISRNVCGLGPYSEADARQMIHYLVSRRSIEVNSKDTAHLIELSGGHAGLLKAALSLLWDVHPEGDLAELIPALIDEPTIQAECAKMWQGLSESEQTALCALVSGTQAAPNILRHLKLKGLVRENEFEQSLFSPLFTDFVYQQIPPLIKNTIVSRSPPMVRIDGRHIETLTELEFEMLCYLYEQRGQVCTKDDLITNVYRQQYDRMKGGVADETLQTLISRLRRKIEPDRGRPRYIVTVRGEGYKFVVPD